MRQELARQSYSLGTIMKNGIQKSSVLERLRQKAEEILNTQKRENQLMPKALKGLNELSHELHTYQIELELQNDELHAAQEELIRSRDKYVDLYDFAPVGYVTLSETGLILEANLTFSSMLGYERQDLTQKQLTSFIVPEHQDQFYLLIKKNLTTKKNDSIQLQLERRDKKRLWLNICSRAITDGPSQKSSFRLIISDIEDLKKKEDELRESERLLRITLDAISDGVFDRNLCTGKIYYGENWSTILGYTQEEIQRNAIKWKDLLHPDDRDTALAAVDEHIAGHNTAYNAQFRMRQKNGLWKWIQARGKVVEWDGDGRPLRFVGTHTDITRQKQMEEELRKNEQRFRTLTELSPAGIYLTAPNGDCVYVNKCWCEMSGLSLAGAEGEGWLKAIHPDDRERVLAAWQKMISSGGSFAQEYRLLALPTGKTTWVYGLAQAFPDNDGGCGGYLGITTDISIKKQAEIELQTAFDKLEKLVKARTVDLERSYEDLLAEVNARKRTEQALRKSEAQLVKEKDALEEVNTALRVLLKNGMEEKNKLEEQMVANVNQLILPHIEDMKKGPLTKRQKINFDFVESNLAKLTSPFLRNISHFSLRLSPMEIKIAHFVKEGKSSKEIAEDLNLSKDTIDIHRKNIRRKCGINGKSQNLRTLLMSLD